MCPPAPAADREPGAVESLRWSRRVASRPSISRASTGTPPPAGMRIAWLDGDRQLDLAIAGPRDRRCARDQGDHRLVAPRGAGLRLHRLFTESALLRGNLAT